MGAMTEMRDDSRRISVRMDDLGRVEEVVRGHLGQHYASRAECPDAEPRAAGHVRPGIVPE
jgi:hypothetical protein